MVSGRSPRAVVKAKMAMFMMILVLLILSPNATVGALPIIKQLKIVVVAAKPSRAPVPTFHPSCCTYVPGKPPGPPCCNTPPAGKNTWKNP